MIDANYIPFGDEWAKHVSKLPKVELVRMLRQAFQEGRAAKTLARAVQNMVPCDYKNPPVEHIVCCARCQLKHALLAYEAAIEKPERAQLEASA